jgi:peptidoglycan/xylan/chitin deacetylase (PgdA/CDA1 family)
MTVLQHSRTTEHLLRNAGNAIALAGRGNRLCVVNYHRILTAPDPMLDSEPDLASFRWQMALLARCFNVLPLVDALAALDAGRLPPRALCITFDDGYRSVHDLALPILQEFGLPATVFVTSGYIDGRNMWNDHIIEAVQDLPAGRLDLRDLGLGNYSLNSLAERKASLAELTEASKYLPPPARLALVDRLESLVGGHESDGLMLSAEMVLNLDRYGIEIGAHTVSHPILTSLDDDSARREIVGSKEALEAVLGKPVRLFAYPNGKPGQDYQAEHVAMVKQLGFEAAVSTSWGAARPGSDLFQLPRFTPWDRDRLRFMVRMMKNLGSRGDTV